MWNGRLEALFAGDLHGALMARPTGTDGYLQDSDPEMLGIDDLSQAPRHCPPWEGTPQRRKEWQSMHVYEPLGAAQQSGPQSQLGSDPREMNIYEIKE